MKDNKAYICRESSHDVPCVGLGTPCTACIADCTTSPEIKTVYTEDAWKAMYANYEGDGTVTPCLILVEWDDPNETPSEAIRRLNEQKA